ncbi:hypothetical protein [Halomonas saccharevitans]|uniref:Glycosaminoglycan attachment site n=1 Tax=Halomonas saccharevitans TaxID=416872 RepID=A0A1I7CA66_9GAMM|nr:hypothetical protein [Halomonas saccharevitans]SFT96326.1 hypothetical protein SAMN04487956_13922 [Halomonas saccharevitans]
MNKLNLFEPVVEEEKLHENFKKILTPGYESQRKILDERASGFIDRDGKLTTELQTTFNSTFWEIYLFAVFKSYETKINFDHSTPDFYLKKRGLEFIVEATTANTAKGKAHEWEKTIEDAMEKQSTEEINKEAIVRLSNALHSKTTKFREKYCRLAQVINRPFVVAIAPFEQKFFNLQYDRPIRALLCGEYIDEASFLENPEKFPYGPPKINVSSIKKENGAKINLGLFNEKSYEEVSAVIFSCTATWGKVCAMDKESDKTIVQYLWASGPNGAPERSIEKTPNTREEIHDGLMVFHNPHAINPLPLDIFRRHRVAQHYYSAQSGEWIAEGMQNALLHRMPITLATSGVNEE